MKSTKSFSNMASVVYNIKRYWWFGLIAFIIEFLMQPVTFMFVLTSKLNNTYLDELIKQEQINGFVSKFFNSFGDMTSVHIFFVGFMGILAGILFFSYVDSKRQIDLLHSLPVSRTKLYATAVLTALLYYFGAVLVNMLLTIVTAAVMGVLGYVSFTAVLMKLYYIMLCYCVMFGITAFAGMLCGAIYAHMEITLLLLFGPLAVYILSTQLFSEFFSTYAYTSELVTYVSPFVHFISGVEPMGLVIYTLAAVALLIVTLVLYKLRPSEKSGSPLVFGASFPFVRAITCYIASVLMGLLLRSAYNSIFALAFGIALGGLLCHMFCEAQYHRNATKLFCDMPALLIFAGAMAAFIFVLSTDLVGFDAYVPEKDNIKCVRLEYGYQETNGKLRLPETNAEQTYIIEREEQEKFLMLYAPENIENAAEIARLIVDNKAFDDSTTFEKAAASPVNEIDKQSRRVKLTYILNSGRKVCREYNMADSLIIAQPLSEMLASDEYVSKDYIVQQQESGVLPQMIMSIGGVTDKECVILDDETQKKLLDTLASDIKKGGSTLYSPAAYIISVNQERDSKFRSYNAVVYSCYEETVKLLRGLGWRSMIYTTPEKDEDKLVRLEVFNTEPNTDPVAVFDDPQQIDKLLGNGYIINEDYSNIAITLLENCTLYGYTAKEYEKLSEVRLKEENEEKAMEKMYYTREYTGSTEEYSPEMFSAVYGKLPDEIRSSISK